MTVDRIIRLSIFSSAPLNVVVAFMFAVPTSSLSQWVGLPTDVPPLYTALTGLLIALFGTAYAWMAGQPVIPRAMLTFTALGKISVFVTACALGLAGHASGTLVALAACDLGLGVLWLWWLTR